MSVNSVREREGERERDLVPLEKSVDIEMELVFLAGSQGFEMGRAKGSGGEQGFGGDSVGTRNG